MTPIGRPFKYVATVFNDPIVQIDRLKFFKNSEEGKLDTPMYALLGYSMMQSKFWFICKSAYRFARDYFNRNNVDVVLCDHFADACSKATLSLKLPFIVTSTILLNEVYMVSLLHPETADRRTSFFKAHHLDIYGAALFIVFAIISVVKVLTACLC
ncbi:hypothetical protein BDF20DRAFT_834807 [Mycotypha africana]|uniref:uncharacterized protein n=1 Tax=Mycotypha africana TaxID=64632 RepID=UPI002300D531|nr:uncharacterized protein BDF20DRAFT_834807 [Mycotypha africana]KAI8982161.1 hypothetical protein BDF20DRAFT_834807 [Mycotypha africana]